MLAVAGCVAPGPEWAVAKSSFGAVVALGVGDEPTSGGDGLLVGGEARRRPRATREPPGRLDRRPERDREAVSGERVEPRRVTRRRPSISATRSDAPSRRDDRAGAVLAVSPGFRDGRGSGARRSADRPSLQDAGWRNRQQVAVGEYAVKTCRFRNRRRVPPAVGADSMRLAANTAASGTVRFGQRDRRLSRWRAAEPARDRGAATAGIDKEPGANHRLSA